MERIAELSHKLESLLDLLRRGERAVEAGLIDLLMGCHDRIGALVDELEEHQVERSSIDDLAAELSKTLQPEVHAGEQPGEQSSRQTADAPEEQRPAASASADEVPRVVYGEDYDKDLFAIFMEQFNKAIQTLSEEADRIGRGEMALDGVLERCVEQIETLKSSANYMEYDQLREHYENWLGQINRLRNQLAADGATEAGKAFEEVIQENIRQAKLFFPDTEKAEDPATVVPDGGAEGAADEQIRETVEEETAPESSDADHDLAAAIAEQFKEMGADFETASLDAFGDDDTLDGLDIPLSSDDDTALLNKLASAFDAQIGSLPDQILSAFPEDIENHLLSGMEADGGPAETPPPAPDLSKLAPADQPNQPGDLEAMLFTTLDEPVQPTEPDPPAPEPFESASAGMGDFDELPNEAVEPSKRRGFGRRKSDKVLDRGQKLSIRVDAGKIDALMNQVGELVVSRSGFNQLFADMRGLQLILKQSQHLDSREMQRIKEITNRIQEATISLSRVTSELQENVMKVRMLPIAQLFSRYPRLVHDLVRNTNKKVDLRIIGEETELDRMVIEQLADPMIHIIRNAVDHGIEDVAVRRQKSKPETGVLRIEAYHEANYVVIEIGDDGKGIDVQMVKKCALEKGFASSAELEKMNDQQIMGLIMRPGFSTTTEVTHTSGRGVGMDVVKDSIEKLNGTVEIENSPGAGACFRIKIPLTLAIIPALLVRLADDTFTIPLATVEETIRIHRDAVSTLEGVEVFYLRDATIPLIRLKHLLNMDGSDEDRQELFVVVVNTGAKQVGLVVDELRTQQEVVIKPIEDYLQEKSGFSGATLLGDGSISLILNVFEIVELSLNKHSRTSGVAVV
jgi:two-component system chemotaxis sensor kinase CheA